MRLIDADAFKAYMRGALEQTRRCYPDGGEWAEAVTEEFCRDIDEQPTVQPDHNADIGKKVEGDCISRQWLMECVSEGWIKFDTEKDENRFIHLVRDIAPSAQPERKKGQWINTSPGYKNGFYSNSYYCSECHDYYTTSPYEMKFCPNCGADMRGGDSNE